MEQINYGKHYLTKLQTAFHSKLLRLKSRLGSAIDVSVIDTQIILVILVIYTFFGAPQSTLGNIAILFFVDGLSALFDLSLFLLKFISCVVTLAVAICNVFDMKYYYHHYYYSSSKCWFDTIICKVFYLRPQTDEGWHVSLLQRKILACNYNIRDSSVFTYTESSFHNM